MVVDMLLNQEERKELHNWLTEHKYKCFAEQKQRYTLSIRKEGISTVCSYCKERHALSERMIK